MGTDHRSDATERGLTFTLRHKYQLSENRKKRLDLNNKYDVKTRIVDKKLVFLHWNVHRDQVQIPKVEQIFDMDGTEKEALKKIKTTGMETNKAGNIFRGIRATTGCFK